MEDKIIIINFKTYKEATGENALNLARICDDVATETNANIFIAPQFTDIFRIFSETNIPIFAQHVDNIEYGSNTGHILPESVKESGAIGSLVNHSERRLKLADIEAIIGKLNKLDMASIVCTNNINTTKAVAALNPDFVAIEPPELIGTGIPVSKAKPEIIEESVKAVEKINPELRVLCGAGITTGEDVKRAIELGTCGVLVASGVVRAKNPRSALLDLVSGLM
ncbi:MAG TPA: triose-phosphate isomerase [Candidatus Altiarchaeales archaeon]|nr:triose-phosphate isomerase [Candidatus Altiarchaeales archaeon]HEX55063.1 triose-phosphate isomerase [Candidatus Altiarchaeales archaeon]